MNEEIILAIAKELNVKVTQVKAALQMLENGDTVPFIARYRKELTGALDEEQIQKIDEVACGHVLELLAITGLINPYTNAKVDNIPQLSYFFQY